MVPSNKSLESLINEIRGIRISQKKTLLHLVFQAILQARQHERSEIARELHDNINQLIMASKLMIDTARKEEGNRQELLRISAQTLEEVINEIRKLSHAIIFASSRDFCLPEAIDKLTYLLSLSNKLRIVARYDNIIEALLSPEQKKQVYRIIQEQFNNIIKHAAATKALLLISYSEHTVRIKIKDNGVGFDPGRKTNGIGISNIGKRVALLKGNVNIYSAINQGSTLDVCFRI